MKKVFEELRLLATYAMLKLAIMLAPPTRQESTLMLYYMRCFLSHANQMKGQTDEKNKETIQEKACVTSH
jgi:hypothetical protein